MHRRGLTQTPNPSSSIETAVQCVYIQDAHPFPEVEEFVAHSSKIYWLALLEYAKPMKAAFADYLKDTPSVKAILVGTRRTDPHGQHLKFFDPTDSGWPAFVRIHPVIDWHYVDIWTVRAMHTLYHLLTDFFSLYVSSTYLTARYTTADIPHWVELLIPTQTQSSYASRLRNKYPRLGTGQAPRSRSLGRHTNWWMTTRKD